jgi:hypothetical protein
VGIAGVDSGVRSLGSWWATANCLTDRTISQLGHLTVDAYFADSSTDPAAVAAAASSAMDSWHARRPAASILFGEYGYSNDMPVDNLTQQSVMRAVLDEIGRRSYIDGLNYWVGAGGPFHGGYTNILTGTTGNWSPRAAAQTLAGFFADH